MPKARTRRKHVACLEGLWHEDITRPFTVRGILQTAAELGDFHFAHLSCNTEPEFDHNLELLRARRGFGVLYLAFHGSPGKLNLPSGTLTLEDLAEKMKTGFRGWVVHLGTCATIKVPPRRIDDFLEATGVAMVIGYEQNVEWLESASTELLLLDHLQRYVDMNRMWTAFSKKYAGLIRLTGMAARSL